jgi:hypothetical protein
VFDGIVKASRAFFLAPQPDESVNIISDELATFKADSHLTTRENGVFQMNTNTTPDVLEAPLPEEAVHVEIEIHERIELIVLPGTGETALIDLIRAKLNIGPEVHFFERNRDEPFKHHAHGRKHVRIVGHPCHQITLELRYEHRTEQHHFAPSATVFKALQWAVSKHGFDLDPMAAAKANLILPGAEQPLPRDDVLGKYLKPGHCTLVVDLTLKDFTNG